MFPNRVHAFICILLWLLISVVEGKPAGRRISSRRRAAPDEAYSTSLESVGYSNQNAPGIAEAYSQNHESSLKSTNDFNDKHSEGIKDTPAKTTDDDDDEVDSDTKNYFKELMDEIEESNRVTRNLNENVNDASRFKEDDRFVNQQVDNGALNELGRESAASNEELMTDGTVSESVTDLKNNVQSDFENNATKSLNGPEKPAYNTSQSSVNSGPHDLKKSVRKSMARRKKKAHSSKAPRKVGSKFNKIQKQVIDRSHHVSPKAVINKILNMMQIPSEETITTTQWNSYTYPIEEFANHGMTSEESLVEHFQISNEILPMNSTTDVTTTQGIFPKQRSLNNPNIFDSGAGKLKLNFPKTHLDKYRSSKIREKIKLINEYRVKEEDLFLEPDLNLQQMRPLMKYTSTPSNFLKKTTQRSKVYPSTSISKNLTEFSTPSVTKTVSYPKRKKYPQSKSNDLSISKNMTQALPTRVKAKVLSLPEKSQQTTSRYFRNPKHTSVTYSLPAELLQKTNHDNQDDALVVILRLPQMVLRELSKVVSYGMEQTGLRSSLETTTIFATTSGKIRKGKELVGKSSEKQLNDSDFTAAQANVTNSNKFTVSTPSNNESSINVRSASGSKPTSRQKENGNSGKSGSNTGVLTTEGNLKRETERSGIISSLTSVLNGAASSQQLTTESHLGHGNVRNYLLSSLLSVLNQVASSQQITTEKSIESQKEREKEKGGLLSSLSAILNEAALPQQSPSEPQSLKSFKALGGQTSESTTQFEENRQGRQAPDFKNELKIFRSMISNLVTHLTDYIEKKPNLTNLQKEFGITYMRKLLPQMVAKHMDELIKEIHNTAENNG